MLKSLNQTDIDAVVAACESSKPASTGDANDVQTTAEWQRVYSIVEQFSREAQEELLALMWTGGPKNGSTFAENLQLARKTWDENHATHIADQCASLPNYLRDGLRRMQAEQA